MSQPETIEQIFTDNIPEGWFLETLKQRRKSIVYVGDRHGPMPDGFDWECQLQHEGGGRLIHIFAKTCDEALHLACAEAVIETKRNGL